MTSYGALDDSVLRVMSFTDPSNPAIVYAGVTEAARDAITAKLFIAGFGE